MAISSTTEPRCTQEDWEWGSWSLLRFKQAAIRVPEIQECHLVSGNFDYLIKARVADIEQYRTLLGETILALPGVKDSRSYIVMETCKEGQELDIKSLTDRAVS